jgi:hypothetical protein
MSVGVGPNHREIDYGEEAEVEGEDQESEKRQEGRPGAEKEEILGKEERREEVRREEVGREEVGPEEGNGQEGRAAEKSRAEARSRGSRTGRSGADSVLVTLRVELRRQRRHRQLTILVQAAMNDPAPAARGFLAS